MGTVNTCTKINRKAVVATRRWVMYILSKPPKYGSAHLGRVEMNNAEAISTMLTEPMISPAYWRAKFARPSFSGGKANHTITVKTTHAMINRFPIFRFIVAPGSVKRVCLKQKRRCDILPLAHTIKRNLLL